MLEEPELPKRVWGYLYLWDDVAGFQSWVARNPHLRSDFGDDLYQAIVTMPTPNTPEQEAVRERLTSWALGAPSFGCPCVRWADRERIGLGYLTATLDDDWFTLVKSRNPWLRLVSCKRCAQCWYLGIDTVDDWYYFLRLSDAAVQDITSRDNWPPDFDTLENVWPSSVNA